MRQPGVEGAEKTGFASRYGTASCLVGNGLAHFACRTLVGTETYLVGASIARPFLTVFSTVTGLADAKDVSALSFMRLC